MNRTISTCIVFVFFLSISTVRAGVYDFDDGTLQGWTNDVIAGENMAAWDTSLDNNGGRTVARSSAFMILESNFTDRDTDTNVQLLSSPQFQVTTGTFVEVWSLGGTGAVATPSWSNYSALPSVAGASGFMGIALRRVSDGEYLLFARRSGPGQSNYVPPGGVGWEALGWDPATIGAAVAGDSAAETYVVDIIDTYTGSWGWFGADDVSISIIQAAEYDFDDGTLQGWVNDVIAGEDMVAWDTSSNSNGGRTIAHSGSWMVLETNFADRDTDTNMQLLTSPQFQVTAVTTVEMWTLGGTGFVATPSWSNYSALPTVASASGFMGIALRRVSDGEYLLFARRSRSGQSNSVPSGWEAIGWDAATIGAAVAGDSITETYVVDIIDTYTGSWGWFGADDVSISVVQAGQYDFDDGTLQGWNNDVIAGEDMVAWDTSLDNNGGRTVAYSGAFMLLETNFVDRDTDTNVQLLSSPQFQITADTFVEVWSLGGTGAVATPSWSNYSALPAVASASGFMGIALRRVSDGEYLLFARRSGPGQSNHVPSGGVGWEAIGWDAATIGSAVAGDSATESYVVDIIDAYTGDWGWIGADDVFIAQEIDITPPEPNPTTWEIVPHVTGTGSITMAASASTDPSGVQYYFDCIGGTANDSGWQSSPEYTDTMLDADIPYTYTVKTRDLSANHNETNASEPASVTIELYDGTKGLVDFSGFAGQWSNTDCGFCDGADLTNDGKVDNNDLAVVAARWLQNPYTEFLDIYGEFLDADSNHVLVVAHRGDWRNAPENSLPAIQNCIDMGLDMVEIDVRMTLDEQLVLMHDSTVDRTTNGSGSVSGMTLAQIKVLCLKTHDGTLTNLQVPTLSEAMIVARGRIMVNLDKAYPIMAECVDILVDTGTLEQAVFKGSGSVATIKDDLAQLGVDVTFMPVVSCSGTTSPTVPEVLNLVDELDAPAVEIVFDNDAHPIMLPENITQLRQFGARVWVNTLWDSLCGGHSDPIVDPTIADPDGWDWCIDRGVNMIQTDRPQWLIDYVE
jgi:glycerophosphoryl diester phosphodiesterase